jgi:hypothetical protein
MPSLKDTPPQLRIDARIVARMRCIPTFTVRSIAVPLTCLRPSPGGYLISTLQGISRVVLSSMACSGSPLRILSEYRQPQSQCRWSLHILGQASAVNNQVLAAQRPRFSSATSDYRDTYLTPPELLVGNKTHTQAECGFRVLKPAHLSVDSRYFKTPLMDDRVGRSYDGVAAGVCDIRSPSPGKSSKERPSKDLLTEHPYDCTTARGTTKC